MINRDLPASVRRYFWGDDLAQLSWDKHQKYITQTLLEKGDQSVISWLLQRINKRQLQTQLKQMKLSPKSANFWQVYFS